MTTIHIKKLTRTNTTTGESSERFALPAVALETPQGKKLIPNPAGKETCLFDTLEEAEQAARLGGFDYEYDGKTTHNYDAYKKAPKAKTGNPFEDSIPLLIQRLNDEKSAVIANAAFALGQIRSEDAIPALCEHLGHDDSGIRKNVAEALANLGFPAIQPLRQAWQSAQNSVSKDAPYVRLTIMTAFLELINSHREFTGQILPMAVEALEDDNWLVRSQAALVLGNAAKLIYDAES